MDTVDLNDDVELAEVERDSDDEVDTDAQAGTAALDTDRAAPEGAAPAGQRLPVEDQLSEREWRMLAFERQWWRHAGAKEQAIRDEFGISATRYYQALNGLLDNPAAMEYDPVLVKRLRRLRATRTRTRTAGRGGSRPA